MYCIYVLAGLILPPLTVESVGPGVEEPLDLSCAPLHRPPVAVPGGRPQLLLHLLGAARQAPGADLKVRTCKGTRVGGKTLWFHFDTLTFDLIWLWESLHDRIFPADCSQSREDDQAKRGIGRKLWWRSSFHSTSQAGGLREVLDAAVV